MEKDRQSQLIHFAINISKQKKVKNSAPIFKRFLTKLSNMLRSTKQRRNAIARPQSRNQKESNVTPISLNFVSHSMLTIENLRRKNFTPEEFLKSQKADASLQDNDLTNDIRNIPNYTQLSAGMILADKMQQLRDAIGKPFKINSAFRCPELNKAVGGAPDSWHQQFLACDFNIAGLEPHEAVLAIKATKISVDKVFVERGCVHLQTNMNDDKNRNFFGSAVKDKNGNWIVSDEIKKV